MARSKNSARSLTTPTQYPAGIEADVVLRDGTSARLRPITPADAPELRRLHTTQSERSRYYRFFTAKPDLTDDELERLTRLDYYDRLAIIALVGERLIAVGRYIRTHEHEADVAFVVADDQQGKGLGTILFDHLAAAARERGIRVFTADVLPDNAQMLSVFSAAGYDLQQEESEGIIHVRVATHVTERVTQVLEERERAAEAQAVNLMFEPTAIMIVGASRQREHVGAHIVRSLISSGYSGAIYPVNPEAYEVNGLKSYASIADAPYGADLAILAVNAQRCVNAIDELAERGVKAVVVVSAGFAEAGPEGAELQRALISNVRGRGMRLLGPASLGFFKAGPGALNASLSPRIPPSGTIALAGQSTALCAMLLAGADARGLEVGEFISTGNRADISLNDALQRWESDPDITLIALSLESLGNPRKFTRLVSRISAKKPIVVVRPPNNDDIGPVDRLAAVSHLPREAMDQVLDAAGAIRTHSVDHLLDTVAVLSREGTPRGTRVGLLSNSSALGATLRAAADSSGLSVAAENFRVPIVNDDRFISRAFTSMAGPGGVDSVIVAVVDTGRVNLTHVASELTTLARGAAVQVLMVVVTEENRLRELRDSLRSNPELPPVFTTAQRATEALSAAMMSQRSGITARRPHPLAEAAPMPIAGTKVRVQAASMLSDLDITALRTLTRTQAVQLLNAYGIDPRPSPRGIPGSVAVIIESVEDHALGPVLSFSVAGDATEIFDDIAFAIPPLSEQGARRLIMAPRAFARIRRAAPESSPGMRALIDLVQRIAQLSDDLPDVARVRLAPVLVGVDGISIVDVQVSVAPAGNRPDLLRRTL